MASENLSPEENAKVKEVLFENNETTFHDPEITTTGHPVRIPPHRIPPGRRKIVEDEILKMEKEGNIQKSSGPWWSCMVLKPSPARNDNGVQQEENFLL